MEIFLDLHFPLTLFIQSILIWYATPGCEKVSTINTGLVGQSLLSRKIWDTAISEKLHTPGS